MEQIREIRVEIWVETNKSTSTEIRHTPLEAVQVLLGMMSEEARLEAFYHYCVHCGGAQLPCHCMNDD